jgi:hypothetical protein
MALIRILLIIVLAYYLVRFIDRYVVPFLFEKPEQKSAKKPGSKGKEFRKKTPGGEVTITDFGGKKKDVRPSDDDYVDYEEVE